MTHLFVQAIDYGPAWTLALGVAIAILIVRTYRAEQRAERSGSDA